MSPIRRKLLQLLGLFVLSLLAVFTIPQLWFDIVNFTVAILAVAAVPFLIWRNGGLRFPDSLLTAMFFGSLTVYLSIIGLGATTDVSWNPDFVRVVRSALTATAFMAAKDYPWTGAVSGRRIVGPEPDGDPPGNGGAR